MLRGIAYCGLWLLAACATQHEAIDVSHDVEERMGTGLPPEREPEAPAALPEGVDLADGLDEDEAVAIAMWNSPRLRADLTRLAVARGDLEAARRPSNPTLRFLFPAGPQQLGLLLTWPLENLAFLRRRVAVARTELDAAAERAVQGALELAHATRLAHIEWRLAIERMGVRQELARRAEDLATIAERRGIEGEVAPREGDAARADARVAADEATRAEGDVGLAEARLQTLMGWPEAPTLNVEPQTERPGDGLPLTEAELEALALESRPDLRASQLAIESAGARLGLERVVALRFAGVVSVSGRSATGGPQVELPIFDQNQGGITRARAQLEEAKWRYQELRQQILAEVTQARLRYDRARASLQEYREAIVDARERDVEIVTGTYDAGEIDYTGVLIATTQLEGVRLREVELEAELRRARAELERALGRRLASVPPPAPGGPR